MDPTPPPERADRSPLRNVARVSVEKSLTPLSVNDITVMLRAVQDSGPESADKLLPAVYEELRRVAAQRMARLPSGPTLQPTALVHEAFMRLTGNPAQTWENRRHFFAAASEAMRHILVDRARRKGAIRHGGDQARVEFEDALLPAPSDDDQIVAVHEALDRLATQHPTAAELVKLRFFAGFTFAQAAELLEISERTAKRLWVYARTWLFEEIKR